MTIADKVLAIAKAEWPKLFWRRLTNGSSYVNGYRFDPLNKWSDLMPLVVKHRITMQQCKNVMQQVYWVAQYIESTKAGEINNLSESEYRRVAVEALYQLLWREKKS